MGETKNKVVGKAKKGIGKATGNRRMQAEGMYQETKGKVQGGIRRAATHVEDRMAKPKARRADRPTPRRRM